MTALKKAPGAKSQIQLLIKPLASIKIAVIIILALGTITAWGTFVEARFGDAVAAQKLVYHSPWMYGVMALLALNLIAVMIDRWPWTQKHTGFVLAHIGIIILMIGSIITMKYGVDGSMSFGMGESSKHVVVGETDFTVYISLDGSSYRKIFDREVDFRRRPPTASSPLEVELPDGKLRVLEYVPYALRDEKIVAVTGKSEAAQQQHGSAVRFQLQNENVNVTEWLLQAGPNRTAVKDLGPAQVVLTTEEFKNPDGRNAIVLKPKPGTEEEVYYEIHSSRDPKAIRRGIARPGDKIETGWMGLVLRVLKFMPQAREEINFKPIDHMTPLTMAAIKVDYKGREQWVAINSLLKLFSDQAVYVVAYANRRIDLGFSLLLKEFKIGRYQGTMRAASYESLVDVPSLGPTLISMNEPLKYQGYTFYQASFAEDESGRPTASILSVNWDPGRWIKYLGSLLIVLGTIHLFYFKHKSRKKAAREAEAV